MIKKNIVSTKNNQTIIINHQHIPITTIDYSKSTVKNLLLQ